jgi:hypothetical protein
MAQLCRGIFLLKTEPHVGFLAKSSPVPRWKVPSKQNSGDDAQHALAAFAHGSILLLSPSVRLRNTS